MSRPQCPHQRSTPGATDTPRPDLGYGCARRCDLSEIARFLADLLLHPALRDRAAADLDDALRGYAVSPAERDLLAAHDPALLAALGEAVRAVPASAPPPARAEVVEVGAQPLPEAALWVRLSPWADGADVRYAVGLAGADAGEAPFTPVLSGQAMPPIDLDLRVLPTLSGGRLTYAGSLLPRGVALPAPIRARTHAPADHPAVRRAVRAARATPSIEAVRDVLIALQDPGDADGYGPVSYPLPVAPTVTVGRSLAGPTRRGDCEPLPGGPHLTIVGLGLVVPDHVTVEAERAIRGAREVLFANGGAADMAWLSARCPRVTPLLQGAYVEGRSRLETYTQMAAATLAAALDHPPVVFAMSGHPLVGAYAPFLLLDGARALGLDVRVQPGISALDGILAALEIDPVLTGLQMVEATDLLLQRRPLQSDMPALVWQVGTVGTLLHTDGVRRPEQYVPLRDHLLRFWPADHLVTAIHVSPHPWVQGRRDTVPLGELDALAPHLHAGVSLFVPASTARPLADRALAASLTDPRRTGV